jgi:hypothetical protein
MCDAQRCPEIQKCGNRYGFAGLERKATRL